ncbi:Ig-like domain-containing protein [Paenibacillus sp. JSM ZJ436]|uniref:Ig-like domain-containing protein n=1 Tax=Paenibacillus sp. JSM ZJ436 TaxID=3376190 RepID=UPI0037B832B8
MKDYSNYYGSSKDRLIQGGKHLFGMHLNGFDSSEVLVNGLPHQVIVTEKYSSKETLRKIMCEHGQLFDGDVIEHENKIWLIRKTDKENPVFDTFTMELAPSSLKWLNSYGEILEYPFIFNSDNISNFGVAEGQVISLLNDRRNIAVRKTDESKMIKVGQRFIFDAAAWEVTSINRLNPLVEIVLKSTTIDPSKDNMELRIADYVKPNYAIHVDQTSISLRVDDTYQIDATVTNNGVQIPSPTLSFISSDNTIASVDEHGLVSPVSEGSCTIEAVYLGIVLTLNINIGAIQSDNYTAIISGDENVYLNKTKDYSCNFYNNELSVPLVGVFSLTNLDGSPTTLASITAIQGNVCTVKGLKIGTVLLTCGNASNNVSTSKTIKIRSAL